jgi:protein involved in polysaccharide export with SLBB domain
LACEPRKAVCLFRYEFHIASQMKDSKMPLKSMRYCLPVLAVLLSLLIPVNGYGQNNLLLGQGGGQSQSQQGTGTGQGNGTGYGQGNGTGYGQGSGMMGQSGMGQGTQSGSSTGFQPLGQGQMQPSMPSLGMSPGTPNGMSAQALLRLVAQNPVLVSQIKILILDRLRQEGRTPPGGQLTPIFVMGEIQNDPALKSELIQLLQQNGVLPLSATGAAGMGTTGMMGAGGGMGVSGGMGPIGGMSGVQGGSQGMMQGSQGMTQGSQGQGMMQGGAMSPTSPSTGMMQANPMQNPLQGSTQQMLTPGMQAMQPGMEQQQLQPNQPKMLAQPSPYGDLQSLQLLYTQLLEDTTDLKRFGVDAFLNGSGNSDQLPADVPAGPDYMLGCGDVLNLHLWGGVENDLSETVDRSGRIELPSTRSVMVAGQTLQEAEESIRRALSSQFKNTKVELSLARVRTVRVYVVGDVMHPGAYDVSSLSTPLSAMFIAGGPTDQGSYRMLKHMRGGKLVATVDLYDLLLKGVDKGLSRLEPGDTILVPPAGPQVTVAGLVRRPAIYEVSKEADLASVVEMAGGFQVSASVDEVNIDRIEEHARHFTMNLKVPKGADEATIKALLSSVPVKDGDRVTISSILPNREDTVFLEGHVFRPGKRAFKSGMQVTDLIHSYGDLMPESSDRAQIIRLVPPEYRPTAIEFRLSEVFEGKTVSLQPFDTIRIYGRYDFDPPTVTINGAVLYPGDYPMGEKMKVSELIKLAGGFKRSAFKQQADLTSYTIINGEKVETGHRAIELSEAMKGVPEQDPVLKQGEVLMIGELAGWDDIGASVTLTGEVMHPGTYGISPGERLSSLIERAGGFRETAFPQGADLERDEVRMLAEKSKEELIERIQAEGMSMMLKASTQVPLTASATADVGKDQQAQLQAAMTQQKQVLDTLQSQPASGRLVVEISADIDKWRNTPADVELRNSDTLDIPKKSDIVMVNGQVYNPSVQTFIPGRTVAYYLYAAGGFTEMANRKNVFVVRANGAVISTGGKQLGGHHEHGDVLNTKVRPGDTVIVPERIINGSVAWRNFLAMAQALGGMAVTARVVTSF